MNDLDAPDRSLLDRVQAGVPLVPRPFAAHEALGLDEGEVLSRLRRLKEAGIIRQIGAIFDTRRLGYQSTLAAFHVAPDALDGVAAQVSAHPGVSHNYGRPHHYNLWFTLAVPPGHAVEDEVRRLAARTGTGDWLNLPALRLFKIRTHFGLDAENRRAPIPHAAGKPQRRAFVPAEIPYVRALQQDLPLVPRPFAETAARFGLEDGDLLDGARALLEAGIMRRFGAVLRHRAVGYTANGMACWIVPESRVEEVGRLAAGQPAVSHCYQRPVFPPRWPYALFTMVHGRTRDEVEFVVSQLAGEAGIRDYIVLYSTHEFKKERVRYFEEES